MANATPARTPNQTGGNSGTNAAIPPSGVRSPGCSERRTSGSGSLSPSRPSQGSSIRLVAPRYGAHLDEDNHQYDAIASKLHRLGTETTFTGYHRSE